MGYMSRINSKTRFAIALLVLVLITFIIISGADTFIRLLTLRTVNASEIVISNIEVNDSNITIDGGTGSSGIAYVSYNYSVTDNNVYIRIKYALVTERNRIGKFEITLLDDFHNINNVYIQGKNKDDLKLIWSK